MAQCLLGLLGYAKEVVTEALWPPIKRHIDYWWSFGDNIQGLRDEIDNLERETRHMDKKIEEARLRAETLTLEVGDWSKKCTQKLEEARRTLQSGNELKASDIFSRYLMGKSAKETTEGIAKLRTEGNLIIVSDPTPPPAMGPIRHEPTMEFRSRGHIEKDVIESLKDDHVRMIAICGPGGVGKTTMVKRIEERVRKENLFDEVVHVVVSQLIDMLKIQKEMAELLGLHLNENTQAAIAHKLHTRLVDSKRKLIVFDDVWKSFNLRDIGVPLENDFLRCKMILTSRVEDACKRMNAQKIIRMNVLTKDEAWSLFKEKAGSYVEDSDLRVIAEDVVKECKGLPLALVIVGEALKDDSIHVWKDSLSQLRTSIPTDLEDVIDYVYKPLKLSYDSLGNERVKSLFLMCCLFPEDYNIPIELLTLCSIGLGMFDRIGNIEDGRSRAHSFVEKLKRRFLLMDGYSTDYVKMHDVVRDVAIFIGSKEKHGFLTSMEVSTIRSSSKDSSLNCNWMSIDMTSIENAKLPVGSDFPNLRLLIIHGSYSSSLVFDPKVICLEGMGELSVLAFSNINIKSLPPTLGSLKKLTTLHLEKSTVEDISIVGELTSLEILCIRRCHNIQVLSADIGRLNRLRFLELNGCLSLKRVVAGVISNLVELEELKIIGSFDKWEAKGNKSEEGNASLSELESLPNLSCLEIDISDQDLVSQEICLSPRLVRYRIFFNLMFDDTIYERIMGLKLPGDVIAVGNWIHQLVRTTQSLILDGDGSNYFNLAEIESLKKLIFRCCSTVKKIDCRFHALEQLYLENLTDVESIVDDTIPEGSNFFQKLQGLHVIDMPKLAHLWRSPNQNVSLPNLKEMNIQDCPNLCAFLSLETSRSLVQLQLLQIGNCPTIEQLFWNETESNDAEDETIEFPQLTLLQILNCPKLRTKIGKCPNLRTIELDDFNGMTHLPRTLIRQLHHLTVRSCDTRKELFVDEIEEEEGNGHIIFPELEELELGDLPFITTFYKGVKSIEFPKLVTMRIKGPMIMNSLLAVDSERSHDDDCLHLFCNEKVQFSCLKTLKIGRINKPIWCRLVLDNFFHNLTFLRISYVNGIRNLMSPSIALNLINLDVLEIRGCQDMIEVVEDDKKLFVTSLFPKLNFIVINRLPKLKSFCQWKHALEFPSLRYVYISDCPEMETFTWGSLSTPNIFELRINDEKFKENDLNGIIRGHFMNEGHSSGIKERNQLRLKDGSIVAYMGETEQQKTPWLAPPLVVDSSSFSWNHISSMVGFHDDYSKIKNWLTESQKHDQLGVMKIVGMSGTGKTTLAKKLFAPADPDYIFRIYVWISVSRTSNVQKVIRGISDSMRPKEDKLEDKSIEELTDILCKSLKDEKYLIVLDDVWDIQFWDDIKSSFPDDGTGSRIILTTRLSEMDLGVRSSKVHHMARLPLEMSQTLFYTKVFGKEKCPQVLEYAANHILENCRRLPLAIVVVGGLLSKVSRTKDDWQLILEIMNSTITSPKEHLKGILSLGYKYLPLNLRACFRSIIISAEDHELSVPTLVRRWIDEGLVVKTGSKSPEEVAEDVLKDLVHRSLIMVYKQNEKGEVEMCGIPSIWQDYLVANDPDVLLMLLSKSNQSTTLKEGMEDPPRSYSEGVSIEKVQKDEEKKISMDMLFNNVYTKDCIRYCSLFPTAFEFTKDILVSLWTAKGGTIAGNDAFIEETCIRCFDILLKVQYIVPMGYDPYGDQIKYKVGDEMHAFLQNHLIRPQFSKELDSEHIKESKHEHLSLSFKEAGQINFEIIKKLSRLQTLIIHGCYGFKVKLLPSDLFLELKSLSVLSLSHTDVAELPSSIENSKALQFLDMSVTPIRWLPESMCNLSNLRTLKLDNCLGLIRLPKRTKELFNLRHLILDVARQLLSMPEGIGNLSELRTLRAFLVGADDGCSINELKNMNKLSGSLRILKLENITTPDQATDASLSSKQDLRKIELQWSDFEDEKNEKEEDILTRLEPPLGIQELKILYYSGGKLPSWISKPSFGDLFSITLHKCRYCTSLPSLGQLPSLKYLDIVGMNEVLEINSLFCGEQGYPHQTSFPALEKLSFDSMSKLEKWTDIRMDDFPCLSSLIIESCPKINRLPGLSPLKSLKHMEISYCPELSCLPDGGFPSTLESLMIKDCSKLEGRCNNVQGEDWSKVAHVPILYIDNMQIIPTPVESDLS